MRGSTRRVPDKAADGDSLALRRTEGEEIPPPPPPPPPPSPPRLVLRGFATTSRGKRVAAPRRWLRAGLLGPPQTPGSGLPLGPSGRVFCQQSMPGREAGGAAGGGCRGEE